ncbi:uncharacterized protein A4U43_C03F18020 [Asparagus officinalis]|uniref:Uncharacterized protein n=1 Tax=Asparagus officinalis TaxID=4686 RepID=A0A5P1FB14_ASPOF|nr:uncharacterized protein A4U43_C03F18020 [Asparagus officinalis]
MGRERRERRWKRADLARVDGAGGLGLGCDGLGGPRVSCGASRQAENGERWRNKQMNGRGGRRSGLARRWVREAGRPRQGRDERAGKQVAGGGQGERRRRLQWAGGGCGRGAMRARRRGVSARRLRRRLFGRSDGDGRKKKKRKMVFFSFAVEDGGCTVKRKVTPNNIDIAKVSPNYHLYSPDEVEAVISRL